MKVVANKREAQGTGASRRLRHAGKVPGVLYGGKGDAQAIEVDHNPLFHALRKENGSLIASMFGIEAARQHRADRLRTRRVGKPARGRAGLCRHRG